MSSYAPANETRVDAASPGGVRDRLHALLVEADAAVAALGPSCALSGRCCKFHEYDHVLFVSAPEAAYLLAEAPPPVRPLDSGATCPWQDASGRCTARDARPLGCRIFFCDPVYLTHAPDLSERFIAKLKRLVTETGLAWDYAPLHHHLRRAQEQGCFPPSDPAEAARASRDVHPADRPSSSPKPHPVDPDRPILS
jgi:Fe-S-cluster containining protein